VPGEPPAVSSSMPSGTATRAVPPPLSWNVTTWLLTMILLALGADWKAMLFTLVETSSVDPADAVKLQSLQ